MEREANYVAVGAFVLLVVTMAALFVYWYSDGRDQRNYTRYEVYFDGSVSGLSTGGQVRYLGVDVGRVVRIRVDQRAADRVQVIVDVDSSAPISERTVAELSLQGVTGLLYIDLQQQQPGAQAERLMEPVPGERYPVIRSIHSNFDVFLSSLPQVASRIGELATRANRVFSDRNIAAIDRLVANVDRAGSALPQTMSEASQLVSELRAATADSQAVITAVRAASATAAPDLAATMARLRLTADHLANASGQLDGLLRENRGALRGFTQQGLPQIEALVRDARDAAREFQALSKSLREDPSQLLYQPPGNGVEIAR
ncbi:MAG: MCE family protein [Gammaproteobacteria bacterium]|nr:MCE family protein [Gammaproteobacteria bacterium]MDE2251547.1 MCE family protein [Gammaproteobacteria bacterium]